MVQALFALNERYFINEKVAVKLIDTFPLHPDHFSEQVSDLLAHSGASPDELNTTVQQFELLLQTVSALCDNQTYV